MTYGPRGQDDFFRGRDGILDTGSVDKDAGGLLAVFEQNFLHLRRLVEVEVGRLTQGLAQERRLG